ncbi:MAG: putative sulfate exporter family transporter [Gammaproteobacteria bacterium]
MEFSAFIDRWRPSALRSTASSIAPGVAATLIVALAATYLSDHYHAPPIIFALLLGMALNQLSAEARYLPGINVSARTLLRISVALLGLRITFGQIGELGWTTAGMVIVTVPLTIGFGWLLAKTMKLDGRYGVLSGGAVGICGASAAMAIAVAWPRKDSERDTVVVIACITTYSTIAMVLYPVLVAHLHLDPVQTGRFLGGSIHDVAQVVAAGYAASPQSGDAATIVKLMRVTMLLPVVLVITLVAARGGDAGQPKQKVALLPGFLIAFVVLAALNGFSLVAKPVAAVLTEVSKWLLVTSVAALGMKTSLREMMAIGTSCVALIAAETVFLGLLVLGWIMLTAAPPVRSAALLTSADSPSRQADAIVRAAMQSHQIPGVCLGVIKGGILIKATGYGYSNVELQVPVLPTALFQSGSVAKQFTAAAVMLLVEEGRVGLDDPVVKYLPEARAAAWNAVTVRQLLTHTSGIPDIYGEHDADSYTKGVLDFHRDYTEDELLQRYSTLPLDFKPGDRWNYSNTGYELLGFLIHRVTGVFYGDFLQERVFRPLGMTATRIISEQDIVADRVSGYRIIDGKLKNQEWIAPSLNTLADGGLYTNLIDLAKWDAALYTDKVLSRSSLQQMWTPVRLNSGQTHPYGFGWELGAVNGHAVQYHTGSNQGFWISISRYVDDALTIIVLTNLDESHSVTLGIADPVASVYLHET